MSGPGERREPTAHELSAYSDRDRILGGSPGPSGSGFRLRELFTDPAHRVSLVWVLIGAVLAALAIAFFVAADTATYHGAPCGNLHEWYNDQEAYSGGVPEDFPSLGTAEDQCEEIAGGRVLWGGFLLFLGGLAGWLAWMAWWRPLRREHVMASVGLAIAVAMVTVPVSSTHEVRGPTGDVDRTYSKSCGSVLWSGSNPSDDDDCPALRNRRTAWAGIVVIATALVAVATSRRRREEE